jgi:hypothetical protein
MTLEHADRFGGRFTLLHLDLSSGPANQVGFNDVDGVHQSLPLLCEYKDKPKCPADATELNDGSCIMLFHNKDLTPHEAEEHCSNITHAKLRGYLPSIHSDQVNTFLASKFNCMRMQIITLFKLSIIRHGS